MDRVNQATVNIVTATVRGRTLGEVAADVRRAVATVQVPAGYGVSFGGRMAALAEGSSGTVWVAALSLFLIIVVLAVQYESLINPCSSSRCARRRPKLMAAMAAMAGMVPQ